MNRESAKAVENPSNTLNNAENDTIIENVKNMNLNGNDETNSFLVETNNNLNLKNGKNHKNAEIIIDTESLPVNEYEGNNAEDSM